MLEVPIDARALSDARFSGEMKLREVRGSRENQKRHAIVCSVPSSRNGRRNNPAQRGGLDRKKNSGHRRSVFLDSSYRTSQELGPCAGEDRAQR